MKRALAIALLLAGCPSAAPPPYSDADWALAVASESPDAGKLPGPRTLDWPGAVQLRATGEGTVEVNGQPTTDPAKVFDAAWEFVERMNGHHREQLRACGCDQRAWR